MASMFDSNGNMPVRNSKALEVLRNLIGKIERGELEITNMVLEPQAQMGRMSLRSTAGEMLVSLRLSTITPKEPLDGVVGQPGIWGYVDGQRRLFSAMSVEQLAKFQRNATTKDWEGLMGVKVNVKPQAPVPAPAPVDPLRYGARKLDLD